MGDLQDPIHGGTLVPYFWPYFVGIFPEILGLKNRPTRKKVGTLQIWVSEIAIVITKNIETNNQPINLSIFSWEKLLIGWVECPATNLPRFPRPSWAQVLRGAPRHRPETWPRSRCRRHNRLHHSPIWCLTTGPTRVLGCFLWQPRLMIHIYVYIWYVYMLQVYIYMWLYICDYIYIHEHICMLCWRFNPQVDWGL